MMRPNRSPLIIAILMMIGLASVAGAYLLSQRSSSQGSSTSTQAEPGVVRVVAAENFWGSLVSQLGGVHANVTSIVSDPNQDPHEYESSPASAVAMAGAQLVIVNGAGYDTWALRMVSSDNAPDQVVLNVQELLNQPLDSNPHFWYSPYYVNDTVHAMYDALTKADPADRSYFTRQYNSLNSSLYSSYMKQEATIRQQFSGAPVASTEDIFVYMANATGLRIVSPPGFMQAVAEGSDPSSQDVATFQDQLSGGNSTVLVLVYNAQTVTPLTQNMLSLAAKNQIPDVRITETIQPPDYTFQAWMQGELAQLYDALSAESPGR